MQPVTGKELLNLIPHRTPFVMINKLIKVDVDGCTSAFIIDGENVLCDNGFLNASGLIENIAQSCAAMSGYISRSENKPTPMGFIGDIRDFTCTKLPAIGEEIITEINVENRIFGVIIIKGTVRLNDEVIALCKMKIFIQPEIAS